MKKPIVLFLIVGISCVTAKSVVQNTISGENQEMPLSANTDSVVQNTISGKNQEIPLSVNTDLKSQETTAKSELLENEIETNEEFAPVIDTVDDIKSYGNGDVDFVIEEDIMPLEEVSLDSQNTIKSDDEDYLSGDRYIDNILGDRIKDEIMETAAGFAPVPLIFRKRQTIPPRRPFAIRRKYQRYPFSPYRRYYNFYPYYSFYRPSSLRFY